MHVYIRRHITPNDNVQVSDTYDEEYIEIFKEDIFKSFREPADKPIDENLEEELKSFSIKLEELNKAFEELKEKLSNP